MRIFPPQSDSIRDGLNSSSRSNMFWGLLSIGAFALFMLVGSFALYTAFGSIPLAMRYLRGERVILEPSDIRLERPKNADSLGVDAVFSNLSDRPVMLMGANSSCSCVVTRDLPVKVESGGRFTLPITVNFVRDKLVDETIVLYTDHPNQSRLGFRVTEALPAD